MPAAKWQTVFKQYIRHLRIQSKHAAADPDGEGIPLRLWTSQRRVLEQIGDALDRDVHIFYILKSRQLGVTTITLAIILFWLALHPNTIGIYVADTEENAEKGRQTIRRYVHSLRGFMGQTFSITKPNNKYALGFSNGSRLDIRIAGKIKATWGEGEGYLAGLLTEVSKFGQVAGIDGFRHTMAPQNPRALYLFESTAFGCNHWKDMWEEGEADPTTICNIFVGWWSNETNVLKQGTAQFLKYGTTAPDPREQELIAVVEERYGVQINMEQLAWKRWNDSHSKGGYQDTDQNQPWLPEQAFVETGQSFFSTSLISRRLETILESEDGLPVDEGGYGFQTYRFILGHDYHLSQVEHLDHNSPSFSIEDVTMRIWEKPVDGAMYSIGFDPAFGRTDFANNHACEVWRCFADKLVQVAAYAENDCTTVQASWVLAWLAGRYHPCIVNIDLAGGVGQVVMQEFQNLRARMQTDWVRNRVGDKFEDFLCAASWYLYHRVDSGGAGFMYNTKTNHDIKMRMMNSFRDSFVTNLLEVRSVPLLREMLNVRQVNLLNPPNARGSDRDDRVFAAALANLTWIDQIRNGMIANAITWESQMAKESGTATPASVMANRMVQSVLVRANEEPDYRPAPSWMESRGLV